MYASPSAREGGLPVGRDGTTVVIRYTTSGGLATNALGGQRGSLAGVAGRNVLRGPRTCNASRKSSRLAKLNNRSLKGPNRITPKAGSPDRRILLSTITVMGARRCRERGPEGEQRAAKKWRRENYREERAKNDAGGGGQGAGGFAGRRGQVEKGASPHPRRAAENTRKLPQGREGAIKGQDGWQAAADAARVTRPGRRRGARKHRQLCRNYKAPAPGADCSKTKRSRRRTTRTRRADEEGVKSSWLRRGRQGERQRAGAPAKKGTVKFWTRTACSKDEFNVQGTRTVRRRARHHRTTTVEIKDVG